ncbi:aminoglycoside phosphotransferase family protein [Actinoallomurus rhizosphaericola]|uniref:aminoglycoside phosphotransferase family protein n=1 Tax=Actinoallomurus rhizosphaericola TaxID=2952536 RepID=UPI0020902C63|nr:aminoglycoside phosphotransferase family protein [Actinoallomurus rhizosphaericola]MCO5994184.1 aminoglycoside phosphotransferase family protein [Actinoallomurus rhizosphaericola]
MRHEWDALPDDVRSAVEQQCGGQVIKAEMPELGCSSEFSATLHLDGGRIFCKGIRADHPAAWMHGNEAAVNPLLPVGLAPRLLWQLAVDGWLMLGFEHAAGRHPDLTPSSPDLAAIAEAITALRQLTPSAAPNRSLAARWARLPVWRQYAQDPPADLDPWEAEHLPRLVELEATAPELVDGDALLHTDLQPGNLLIEDGAVMVIDWAWASRGAAWVDPAFMVIRLMAAGHSPQSAEVWASQIPAWREAPAAAVTAFAATVLGLWGHKTRSAAARPHSAKLTAVARNWARHRLEAA